MHDLKDTNEIDVDAMGVFHRRSFVDRDPIDLATLSVPSEILFHELNLPPIVWPAWTSEHPFGESLVALNHEIESVVPDLFCEPLGIRYAQISAWAGTLRSVLDRAGNRHESGARSLKMLARWVMERVIHARRRLGVSWIEAADMDWETDWEVYVVWQRSIVLAQPPLISADLLRDCVRETARTTFARAAARELLGKRLAHFHLRRFLAVLDSDDPALSEALQMWGVPVDRRDEAHEHEARLRRDRAWQHTQNADRKRERIAQQQAGMEAAALRRAADARRRLEVDRAAAETVAVSAAVLGVTRACRLLIVGGEEQQDLLREPLKRKLELAELNWITTHSPRAYEIFWNEATGSRAYDVVFVVVDQKRVDQSSLVRACSQTRTPLIYLFQGFSMRLICKAVEMHVRLNAPS
jgi:hypothetical protein